MSIGRVVVYVGKSGKGFKMASAAAIATVTVISAAIGGYLFGKRKNKN